MKQIILKRGKEIPVKRKHPWIFSGAIYKIEPGVEDGDWVQIIDSKDNYLASGHYNDGNISIRILTYSIEDSSNLDFWVKKIKIAYDIRKELLDFKTTNCYRLIHAEGDGCAGLIIDIYDNNAVIQCHSPGMIKDFEIIASALEEVFEGKLDTIYNKSKKVLPKKFKNETIDGFFKGSNEKCIVLENNNQFIVNWVTGQKTGFFLDQRENRDLLSRYVVGKSVLNAFCYSGGFSIYALNNGAKEVHSVDISETAIELTNANVKLLGEKPNHKGIEENVMVFLKDNTQKYDVIILDPPAFAKSKNKKHNAVQAYKRLNIQGIKSLKKGGILFTFSCSQVIDTELFYNTIVAAAIETNRKVKVLHKLNQGPDHPVDIFHKESHYLKGLVLWVE